MAQERGRQGQVGRRDRGDRDRQGDDGSRGRRRGHDREDFGARRHAGCAGQRYHRGFGRRRRGREGGQRRRGGRARTESRRSPEARCCACASGPDAGSARSSTRIGASGCRCTCQDQWPRARLLVAARPSSRQGSRHRHRAHQRLRPAWPHRRPRRRGRQVGQGPESAGRDTRCSACDRAGDVGQANPFAVRGRLLRDRAA